ncbi:MAG TPA: peroxidase-related enzyme [Acidimicrobiia bacterium]|jgi:uncharacterized peroxidase-related enzyme
MPHIALPEGVPGIRSGFAFRPETATPLLDLAEVLLRDDNTLSRGEREIIASYVSKRNECDFCRRSHTAFAAHQTGGGPPIVEAVLDDPSTAPISAKLRALLGIAAKVQESGRAVTDADIAAARDAGATDLEIHDTVLIAAAFCMYNRYVDGLAALTPPEGHESYELGAQRIVADGYRMPR